MTLISRAKIKWKTANAQPSKAFVGRLLVTPACGQVYLLMKCVLASVC